MHTNNKHAYTSYIPYVCERINIPYVSHSATYFVELKKVFSRIFNFFLFINRSFSGCA